MKIFVLPVDSQLQPRSQPFRYPAHNADYGVEQDFLDWLEAHPEHRADDPSSADWHLLPVFWNRWHYSHDYGRVGHDVLAELTTAAILDDSRTFTVCQFDGGPTVDLGETVLCLAARRGPDGIDVPLLSERHRVPLFPPKKRYMASFVGRFRTHPVREELARALAGRPDVRMRDRELRLGIRGFFATRSFVRMTLASYIALSPRGYGGSSYRFFEAMGLGVMPYLVGDLDTRPFKRTLDWSRLSFFGRPDSVPEQLDHADPKELLEIGAEARRVWEESLTYQRWCPLLLGELELVDRAGAAT